MILDNTEFARNYVNKQLKDRDGRNNEYIVFEALIRKKDKVNTHIVGDSLLLRSWFIDSPVKFELYADEMKHLCDVTGARLYMATDTKSTKKFALHLVNEFHKVVANLLRNNDMSVKNLINLPFSALMQAESNIHNKRKYLIDIDVPDADLRKEVERQIIETIPENVSFSRLDTVNGAHIIIDRDIPYYKLKEDVKRIFDDVVFVNTTQKAEVVVKENAMTVVYYNVAHFNNEDV